MKGAKMEKQTYLSTEFEPIPTEWKKSKFEYKDVEDYRDVFNLSLVQDIQTVGKYDLPALKPTNQVPKKVIPFNYALSCERPQDYFVHFYIDDYQFERIWHKPKFYALLLQRFAGIIGPDFSTYTNMPKAQQIFQVYKSRLISAYIQSLGQAVIPNINWSTFDSLNWTMDGVPRHSTIALSTNGCLNSKVKDNFVKCYKKAIEILEPTNIVIVGEIPKEIQKDDRIINFDSYLTILQKKKRSV